MIDISTLFLYPGQVGGAEMYLYNLLEGFIESGTQKNKNLIINENIKYSRPELFDQFNKSFINLRRNRAFYELLFPIFREKKKSKITFFPNYVSPLRIFNGNYITTIHDIQFRNYPEYFSLKRKKFQDFAISNTLKSSNKVVCISNFVKEDIIRHYGEKYADKLEVIYNPINFNKLESEQSITKDFNYKYILSVAAQWPNKNILRLIKAFKKSEKSLDGLKLVLVGQFGKELKGGKYSVYQEEILKEVKGQKNIIQTGFVSDSELSNYYRNCEFLAFPSFFEGFGMPVIEAMGMGIPVLCSKETALEEVSLGKANYIDNPFDIDSISESLINLNRNITEIKKESTELKLLIREKYNPKVIAGQYDELFNSLIHE